MAGKNITQFKDPLSKINFKQFRYSVLNPKNHIASTIDQLRKIRTIDQERYRQLKTKLPYITTGIFNPPFRKRENFAWLKYFILDIDHLSEKGLSCSSIKSIISEDPLVLFAFNSPSQDGLKVFFKLEDKCYDPAKYSLVYKKFASDFMKKHNLEQVLDRTTHDVARACFISYDKDAYLNENAQMIRLREVIDFNDQVGIKSIERELKEEGIGHTEPKQIKNPLQSGTMDEIKKMLNPKYRVKPKKQIHVPLELEEILENVVKKVNQYDIVVKEIKNIHYGKKFVFMLGSSWCELNVFYGKKGFTVVKSPKNGSDKDLLEVCHQLLCELFYGEIT